MNKRDIAILALKLMSLYILFQATNRLDNIIFLLHQTFGPRLELSDDSLLEITALMSITPFAIWLLFAATLWFASGNIADRMTKNMSIETPPSSMDIKTVIILAFAVAGIFIIVPAFTSLLASIGEYITIKDSPNAMRYLDTRWKSNIYKSIIQLALGLWLLFGPQPIARIVMLLRQSPKP